MPVYQDGYLNRVWHELGPLGPIPICTLRQLFNYYFSNLQNIVHFVIDFPVLSPRQKYYTYITNIILP